MNVANEMVSLPKNLYAKIFFQLNDEQLQKIYDNASSEEKTKIIELRRICA